MLPTGKRRAVEVAIAALHQSGAWSPPMVDVWRNGELHQRGQLASRRHLENGAKGTRPAGLSSAVAVAIAALDKPAARKAPHLVGGEIHQRRKLPGRRHPKNRAAAMLTTAIGGRAVEVAIPALHQPGEWMPPMVVVSRIREIHQLGQL